MSHVPVQEHMIKQSLYSRLHILHMAHTQTGQETEAQTDV